MNLTVYFFVLVCISGPSCPKEPIVDNHPYYSQQSCETDAKLVAQGMYVSSRNKYGYSCEPSNYEPPKMDARCHQLSGNSIACPAAP